MTGPPNSFKRARGRPRGPTAQGELARRRLFTAAVRMIGKRGFEATTLRDIANRAGVSVGLLYRYFPSKRAVLIALYDELSSEYAARAANMAAGAWSVRFLFALRTSLEVLQPHRSTLLGLVPVLVGGSDEAVLGAGSDAARQRVRQAFVQAVVGAIDAPDAATAEALGRLLYLAHLIVILWWLLDRTPEQRATAEILAMLQRGAPLASLALAMPGTGDALRHADKVATAALFGAAPPRRRRRKRR